MENKQVNGVFDIVKIILSLFVVAIHTPLYPSVFYPWLRVAVPLFFMLSAYFLFQKVSTAPQSMRWGIVKKYVIRNLKLYLFYFILLAPITIYVRGWYKYGLLKGVVIFVRDLLFHSTFRASWFIMSSVIAVLILTCLSKRLSNGWLIAIASVVYSLVALRSSYWWLIEPNSICDMIADGYDTIFTMGATSFPVAFSWMVVGKVFAENEKRTGPSCAALVVVTVLSMAALYLEWRFVAAKSGANNCDCYYMLVPLCIMAFWLILRIPPVSFSFSPTLRRLSTVIYALHASVLIIITAGLERLGLDLPILSFAAAVAVCVMFYFLISWLGTKRYFQWLKYAY